MSQRYIVVIDQGTTSTRSILFDRNFNEVVSSRRALQQQYPKKGWVEHDPNEIIRDVIDTCNEVISKVGVDKIDGISITNQRETTIIWDKNSGEPIYPAIVWQDRRTQGYCLALSGEHLGRVVQEKTGLLLDPYFSATKINWILNNVSAAGQKAEDGDLLFGTVDTYITWMLTGSKNHVTDITNASRTMLYNIISKGWDEELIDVFKIPKNMLPDVVDNDSILGYTNPKLFGASLPILTSLGDQQSATIGQACIEENSVKCTLGTGCFLVLNTGEDACLSRHKLLTTIAYKSDNRTFYAMEGSIFMAGAIIQWLRDKLGIVESSLKTEDLAKSVQDNNGVYMVPAFTGLGAPHWVPSARASIFGITRDTKKAHIVRAGLEAVAYQLYDIVEAMKLDTGRPINNLRVDGGMAKNYWLLQHIADVLNCNVDKPHYEEATAYGALFMGSVNCGWESNLEKAVSKRKSEQILHPSMGIENRDLLLNEWQNAVDSTLFHSSKSTVSLS